MPNKVIPFRKGMLHGQPRERHRLVEDFGPDIQVYSIDTDEVPDVLDSARILSMVEQAGSVYYQLRRKNGTCAVLFLSDFGGGFMLVHR